jgi:ArsR family transcriptional regulator
MQELTTANPYRAAPGSPTGDDPGQAAFAGRARVMKALGHPTRLYFIHLLAAGEACVCHLAGHVDADLSTVSRHLAVLRSAGLITQDKRGQQVWYRLAAPCVLNFFSCLDSLSGEGSAISRQP